MPWEIEMEELCDKGVEGTEGQIKRENELLLLSECSSVSGGKSIKGISAGWMMARGCWRERGRDLINQVNPFLRSFVDSVEIQFEKRAQTASTESMCLQSTAGITVL